MLQPTRADAREAPLGREECAARLAPHTAANTRPLSLAGREGWARLLDVHDGDTLTVAAEVLPGEVHRVRVRLAGVDACELSAADDAQRALADRARQRLAELLLPELGGGPWHAKALRAALARETHLVWLECTGADKYGRALARASSAPGRPCASRALLAEGLASEYGGRGARAGELLRLQEEGPRPA